MARLAHDTAEFELCANQHIRALNFIDTMLGHWVLLRTSRTRLPIYSYYTPSSVFSTVETSHVSRRSW